MSLRELLVMVLLGAGVALTVLCVIGMLCVRTSYQKLHYLGPISGVSAVAIAAAVVVQEGLSQSGVKAILIALLLFVSNPVLTHATARAIHARRSRAQRAEANEQLSDVAEPETS